MGAPILTITCPGLFINFLFFQYLPELWHIGRMGLPLLLAKTPQLLANGCIPFSDDILVPSGKRITEKPFLSFKTPLSITFFKLLNLLARFNVIGFMHLNAQPKKGIYRSSFFIMLVDGNNSVCK